MNKFCLILICTFSTIVGEITEKNSDDTVLMWYPIPIKLSALQPRLSETARLSEWPNLPPCGFVQYLYGLQKPSEEKQANNDRCKQNPFFSTKETPQYNKFNKFPVYSIGEEVAQRLEPSGTIQQIIEAPGDTVNSALHTTTENIETTSSYFNLINKFLSDEDATGETNEDTASLVRTNSTENHEEDSLKKLNMTEDFNNESAGSEHHQEHFSVVISSNQSDPNTNNSKMITLVTASALNKPILEAKHIGGKGLINLLSPPHGTTESNSNDINMKLLENTTGANEEAKLSTTLHPDYLLDMRVFEENYSVETENPQNQIPILDQRKTVTKSKANESFVLDDPNEYKDNETELYIENCFSTTEGNSENLNLLQSKRSTKVNATRNGCSYIFEDSTSTVNPNNEDLNTVSIKENKVTLFNKEVLTGINTNNEAPGYKNEREIIEHTDRNETTNKNEKQLALYAHENEEINEPTEDSEETKEYTNNNEDHNLPAKKKLNNNNTISVSSNIKEVLDTLALRISPVPEAPIVTTNSPSTIILDEKKNSSTNISKSLDNNEDKISIEKVPLIKTMENEHTIDIVETENMENKDTTDHAETENNPFKQPYTFNENDDVDPSESVNITDPSEIKDDPLRQLTFDDYENIDPSKNVKTVYLELPENDPLRVLYTFKDNVNIDPREGEDPTKKTPKSLDLHLKDANQNEDKKESELLHGPNNSSCKCVYNLLKILLKDLVKQKSTIVQAHTAETITDPKISKPPSKESQTTLKIGGTHII